MKATEVGWAGHKTRGIKKDVQVNKQVLGCCEKKKILQYCVIVTGQLPQYAFLLLILHCKTCFSLSSHWAACSSANNCEGYAERRYKENRWLCKATKYTGAAEEIVRAHSHDGA